MREIKFRAWFDMLESHGQKGRYFSDSDLHLMGDKRPYPGDLYAIWEQYTGLKDKNDREIYEGDIVLLYAFPDPAPVIWEEGAARFSWCGHSMFDDFFNDSEIVGNIHEGML